MMLDSFRGSKEANMFKKLFGAAAMAAVVCAVAPAVVVVPAATAKTVGCSSENLEKAELATEAMADGAGKTAAHKEVTQAQEALLNGKMDACATHLSKAMQAGTMNQAPYGATMNQAPTEATSQAPSQSQWNWQPVKPAL